jgi:hypothetical protein
MLRVVLNVCVTKTTAAEILANPATRRRQATMTISAKPPLLQAIGWIATAVMAMTIVALVVTPFM